MPVTGGLSPTSVNISKQDNLSGQAQGPVSKVNLELIKLTVEFEHHSGSGKGDGWEGES